VSFALGAAVAGLAIDRLALHDVPYDTSEDASRRSQDYREQLGTRLAEGRRGGAVELFMRLAGSSDEDVVGAHKSPYWPGLEALAHTLAHDAALYGPPPVELVARITQPTLVIPGGGAFYPPAADAIVATIPDAERPVLDDQGHVADPKLVAPVLRRFFGARSGHPSPGGLTVGDPS
jgi:hypothetical protein